MIIRILIGIVGVVGLCGCVEDKLHHGDNFYIAIQGADIYGEDVLDSSNLKDAPPPAIPQDSYSVIAVAAISLRVSYDGIAHVELPDGNTFSFRPFDPSGGGNPTPISAAMLRCEAIAELPLQLTGNQPKESLPFLLPMDRPLPLRIVRRNRQEILGYVVYHAAATLPSLMTRQTD